MIIEQNQLTQPKMNQLMFNIQTKLSLLSQIQKSAIHNANQYRHQHQSQVSQQMGQNNQVEQEIDLPMQMLDKKMQQIINQKSPVSQKRNHYQNHAKTYSKKRLQLNQLQTATRNIDEIKRNLVNDLANPNNHSQYNNNNNYHQGNNLNHYHQANNLQHKPSPQQEVRQFSHQTEQSMTESMLDSGSKSKSSSKILTKFNQIQLSYIDKIKSLSFKLSFLQQKLTQSQQENKQLMESLQTYKLLYSRKQQQVQKQIQKRLEEIRDKLIQKFAQQCRLKYNQYITELKQSNTQLNEQRKKRKYYEQQNKIFKLQKQNYQQLYKNLAHKQKLSLQLDINNTKNSLINNSNLNLQPQQYLIQQEASYLIVDNHKPYHVQNHTNDVEEYSQIQKLTNDDQTQFINKENLIHNHKHHYHKILDENKANTKFSIQKSNKSNSKSKQKSLSKSKDHSTSNHKNKSPISQKKKKSKSKTQTQHQSLKHSGIKKNHKQKPNDSKKQMTKEQLIPFLAQGIQQLKERLKMK